MIFFKQLNMQKKLLHLFNIFFIFFFYCNVALSNVEIFVSGNKNIQSETIKKFFSPFDNNLSKSTLNDYQKKLLETGFFEEVTIKLVNNKLNVVVKENPLINFFYIEGIKKKQLIEKIRDLSKIKEAQIFSFQNLYEDINLINNYLKKLGYVNNKIEFKLNKLPDNKINVFYNVKLNDLLKINRIYFIGQKFFKSSTLNDVISLKEDGWWKFFSNTIPSQERLEYDTQLLKKFYLDNGFYDVQILSTKINILDDNKKADIIFSINSGEIYILNKVVIQDFSKKLNSSNLLEINNILNKNANNKYNKSKILKSINDAQNFLYSRGLDLIYNISDTKLKNNKINLNIKFIEKKIKQQVRYINYTGNNITNESVLRNNTAFVEGDNINSFKLNKSIDLIESTKIFQNVKYSILPITETLVDVNFSVEEKASGEISAGAGFGTDGAQISGMLSENNFLGKGIKFVTSLDVGTNKILGNILVSNPDFYSSGNRVTGNFFVTKNYFENAGFENKLIGSKISTSYEIFENIYFSPGFEINFDDVSVKSTASSIIKKSDGNFYTNKINYTFTNEQTNKKFNPTAGFIVGFGQDIALPPSNIPYLENNFFGSYYKEIFENFNGSIKYGLSSINSITSDDIKFSDRLFVSSKNIKGFAPRGIGPVVNSDYIGGNYNYYTSLSSSFPNGLPESWNAKTSLFFDLANVWGADFNNNENESNLIRSSAGFGLEWISPLGPVSVSYAEPITKKNTDKIEQFSIKIGTLF